MSDQEGTKALDLGEELVSRVEGRLSRTEFDTVEAYVTYVLEEVLSQVEADTEDEDFQAVDEAQVKDRLRSLGYLNE